MDTKRQFQQGPELSEFRRAEGAERARVAGEPPRERGAELVSLVGEEDVLHPPVPGGAVAFHRAEFFQP